jgi:invasion protein IalB
MNDDFFTFLASRLAARQSQNGKRPGLRTLRSAVLAAAAMLAGGLLSSAALAQGTAPGSTGTSMQPSSVRANYGAWSIVCDQPPGASSEQCVLMQNVVAADREEFGLSVVVLKTADKKAQILRVLAPLGVLLPNGLGLNIDGTDIGRAYFVRCFTDGCYAEVILEESLIKALEEGQSATFYVFQTPEEGIGIPVDLSGFTDGYKALP